MKFLIFLLLLSSTLTAQVAVNNQGSPRIIGEVRNLGTPIATLSTTPDSTYTLKFRDKQFADDDKYQSITFKATPDDIATLYNAFKQVHHSSNIKNKSFSLSITLGPTPVTIKNYTYMGVVMCEVVTPSGFFQLTKNQVDKLFGK